MSDLLSPGQVEHLLNEFFEQHLPISRYLNMRCQSYSGDSLSLAIDLQPSLNDKLTAFGGSLYCACVMNCWGMAYLQGRQRGINPNIVVSHAEIDYLVPVTDEVIVATCHHPEGSDWDRFYRTFERRGKARCRVSSSIHCGGAEAVRFQGQYAVIGASESGGNGENRVGAG